MNLYEGSKSEITVFNYNGDALNPPISFLGTAMFLKKAKRILLAQKSAHYLINKSMILDSDGKILSEVDQNPNVYYFGHSNDEKVIWLLSNTVRKGRPLTIIKIIDCNGKSIKNMESGKEEKIKFNYNGLLYEFKVESPRMPG